MIKNYIYLFIKGLGIGAANVIPGVSGGTIALITGIFEKLIHSLKSFDLKAIKLLFSGKFKAFSDYTNLDFLIAVFAGVFVSILTFARLLEFLFQEYPVYVWSYFFGLILASVYYVGKTIGKLSTPVIISFLLGTGIALAISFLSPATENRSLFYLVLCGVVAVCSMILPGLSGSFVLILMGNYELVFIEAVNKMELAVLLPVVAGAAFGLLAFSHVLSWVYNRFRGQTVSLLTGFILGSLSMLWPWKKEVFKLDDMGGLLTKPDGTAIIQGYEKYLPSTWSHEVAVAVIFIMLGVVTIVLMERLLSHRKTEKEA